MGRWEVSRLADDCDDCVAFSVNILALQIF